MDESYIWLILSFLTGFIVGGALVYTIRPRSAPEEAAAVESTDEEAPSWWLRRKGLSGSQLQILQFIEAQGDTSIQDIQKRFKKVPDRELFYRMEQIHLLGFLDKERGDNAVIYRMTADYAEAVEALQDDKTVMLPPSS